jgi:hypothetical protein
MGSLFVFLIVAAVVYVVIGGLRDAERERIARVRFIQAQQNARWAREEAEREAYLQRRRLEDAQYESYYSSDGQDLVLDEDTAVAIHNWHVLSNFDTNDYADIMESPEDFGLYFDESGRLQR